MRIALIHAVSVTMQPVADAFARDWPAAELVSLCLSNDFAMRALRVKRDSAGL